MFQASIWKILKGKQVADVFEKTENTKSELAYPLVATKNGPICN